MASRLRRFAMSNLAEPMDIHNYLTIVAVSDIKFHIGWPDLQYIIDGKGVWRNLTQNLVMSLSAGQTMSLRGHHNDTAQRYGTFFTEDEGTAYELKGNVMSLIYGDDANKHNSIPQGVDLQYLFRNKKYLKRVSENFLPATILSEKCYYFMFSGCESLEEGVIIPNATLAPFSCAYMYDGCTNLKKFGILATDFSAFQCVDMWSRGVSSVGTFVKAEGVEIPTGTSGIPSGWTVEEVEV